MASKNIERCVCATLRKATRSVTQLYDTKLRPSGLRATQFNILAEVYGAGEATVSRLAKLLVIDQTTMTRSLALLQSGGLIVVVPKPDGRLKSVRLTKQGEAAVKRAYPLWAMAQKEALQIIGRLKWVELGRELERIAGDSSA